MTVGILAVQGDFAAHARVLKRLQCEARLVRQADDIEGLDAIILPGGESTAMLTLLALGGLMPRLRAFVSARPVLATCAGAILLARRVSGPAQPSLAVLDITAARNAYGRQIDSSIRRARVRPEFAADLGGEELETVLIRAPRFQDLGSGVEIVAEAGDEPVLLRQGQIMAASFHPELGQEDKVHRWFLAQAQIALQSR
ncbi:MAG TPA: pyridoxal 5'-phosphate synthase glutaminase subunit PdxT [Terriglobales bacterium]|nr:pyridoxal 5'-phosphate synthase glutaminase subunit PdxT [Terriglobales bacterium]